MSFKVSRRPRTTMEDNEAAESFSSPETYTKLQKLKQYGAFTVRLIDHRSGADTSPMWPIVSEKGFKTIWWEKYGVFCLFLAFGFFNKWLFFTSKE